uniref:Uncharacterized protein n=1 Tax=Nelumbo nucifera TaxID=4432 RepID=A0A822XLB5_NELNU|nr:TPA_asm: hypothetical protein HUJ06_022520 [Nelumbo nucifera]
MEGTWEQRIQALTHILTSPIIDQSLHSQLFISTQVPCYLNWGYPPVLSNKDQKNSFPFLHLRGSLSLFEEVSKFGLPETSWRSKYPFQQPPPLILAKGVEEAPPS